jgi:hypothetical protein
MKTLGLFMVAAGVSCTAAAPQAHDGSSDAGVDVAMRPPLAKDASRPALVKDATLDAVDAVADSAVTLPPCSSPEASTSEPCGTLAFAKSPVASRPRNHHVTLLASTNAGPMLYVLAGANTVGDGSVLLPFVDRVPIMADGSLGAWSQEPMLPTAIAAAGPVGEVVSEVIVIAGGLTLGGDSGTGTVTDAAYSAVIKADGSLAGWNPAGTILKPRMHAGSIMRGSTMWILGGYDGVSNVWDDIVSATVKADGTVSTWVSAGQLPGPLSHFAVTLVDDYVYLTGGNAAPATSNPPIQAATWRGQIAADGTLGAWQAMPDLPVAEATHAMFFYGGYLNLCGGINESTGDDDLCWRAPLAADHSLGTFAPIAPVPIARGHVHQMPVWGTHVYSVAGAIDLNLDSTTEVDIGSFDAKSGQAPGKKLPTPRRSDAPGLTAIPGTLCHGHIKGLRIAE